MDLVVEPLLSRPLDRVECVWALHHGVVPIDEFAVLPVF